jgi:hypothetical protein
MIEAKNCSDKALWNIARDHVRIKKKTRQTIIIIYPYKNSQLNGDEGIVNDHRAKASKCNAGPKKEHSRNIALERSIYNKDVLMTKSTIPLSIPITTSS